jgi:hypothetical protein
VWQHSNTLTRGTHTIGLSEFWPTTQATPRALSLMGARSSKPKVTRLPVDKLWEYLNNVLDNTQFTTIDSHGRLYFTYEKPDRNYDPPHSYACDVYDNAVMANALMEFDQQGSEDGSSNPHATYIIHSLSSKFIRSDTITKRPEPGLVWQCFGNAEGKETEAVLKCDFVGNTTIAAMAILKFVLKYPKHPRHQAYLNGALDLARAVSAQKISSGRFEGYRMAELFNMGAASIISTEQNIDTYALGVMLEELIRLEIVKDASIQKLASELRKVSEKFIADMYEESSGYYFTGTKEFDTPGKLQGQVETEMRPADTCTWSMLAHVDMADKERKKKALQHASDTYTVRFPTLGRGTQTYWGIKFSTGSVCVQHENTGSYLTALDEYTRTYGEPVSLKVEAEADKMRNFICDQITKFPFRGIFGGYLKHPFVTMWKEPERERACPSGLGWVYLQQPHLVATAYCALAVAPPNEVNTNAFRFRDASFRA